ncbi:MAG: DNA polymerase III subunit delta [Pseudomonadota bacterium]|nr:DNA polymerase III subunit delta [Pseudomonadota bacterium]
MDVRAKDLVAHLERGLSSVYVVHGDEPLLALEAGDAIRTAARRSGCEERELLIVEPGFKWDAFVAGNANLGLFATRKLVDMRIASGKPGTEGARALENYARDPNPDTVFVLTLPRLDRAAQSAGWFTALAGIGIVVAVYPLERSELPAWIAGRFKAQGQRVGRDTLEWIADRCEGNLFAARQEIEKLALLLPQGEIAHAEVEAAVANVARYDVLTLSEAWLNGDSPRTLRVLAGLQAEGEGVPLVLWQFVEDVHALASVLEATATGTPVAAAVRNARVWGKRQNAMERAARRVDRELLMTLLSGLARLDALAKGIGRGNAWDELRTLALAMAGTRFPDAEAFTAGRRSVPAAT